MFDNDSSHPNNCQTFIIFFAVNRPSPVYQRPPRQPGSTPYKPPVIPIRQRPPQSQPIPKEFTPHQAAPTSNQANWTAINPRVQGKMAPNEVLYIYI